MPVLHACDAVVHELHGSVFTSFAAPARGSRELCAWRLEVAPGTPGQAHRVTREEVLYVLTGLIHATIDGEMGDAGPGDAILVPAGATLNVTADEPSTAWVTTSAGLAAVLPDGSWLAPSWTR